MREKQHFIKQLQQIVDEYNAIKSKATYDDLSGNVLPEELTNILTRAKASVQRITGVESEYYKDISKVLMETGHKGKKLREIIGTVLALKTDIEQDYLKTLSEIIQADVFSDYLEMANYLLEKGYKDPAAVIIGSTLEVHLKELCIRNSIEIESNDEKGHNEQKKTETLNSELKKRNVYSLIQQKQITAWLGIRNSAAHGQYNNYTLEQVKLMLDGVKLFLLESS